MSPASKSKTKDKYNPIPWANEYDSVSNNGSWSGESEDHKEKASQSIPGADNDKREKIRHKNERKHQRQKERRAQELHQRCSGYLMSRKLEALAQQLVAMGFSQERATMALIMNEGRVEESIAWLLEGGEEDKIIQHNLHGGGGDLIIDISEELARITDIEIRYKASRQEVERVVVSCEGDLDKATEIVKAQKEEPFAVPSKTEENSKLPMETSSNPLRIQPNFTSSIITQHKREEKDFNYTKVPTAVGSSVDPGAKTMQVLKKIPPKSDWEIPQQIEVPAEKRWENSGSSPSTSFSLASPMLANIEAQYAAGSELKNLQLGSVKEPVIVMQRPQSSNTKQAPSTSLGSSPTGLDMAWYPSSLETMKVVPPVVESRSHSPNGVSSNPLQPQPQYVSHNKGNNFWGRGASPALAATSSLGLFSGIGSNGCSSMVDWNTGSSRLQFDYTNIDWSLDRRSLSTMQSNARTYDSFVLQDGVTSGDPSSTGSWEWTSPFEEKDLFSLPRQFVTSPSL